MVIFSKHWSTSFNLSEVPKTGGLESSVIMSLRTETEHGTAPNQRHMYGNVHLNYANSGTVKWYNNAFKNMTAHARSSRSGILRKEELQAMTFAVSSTLPIHGLEFNLTHQGTYFSHSNSDAGKTMIFGDGDNGSGPIELFEGWKTDVFKACFKHEPRE